jgi:hypothetical protein
MARLSTLARFEVSGEILSEDTVALLASRECKLAGAEMDEGDFAAAWALLGDQWQSIRSEVAEYDTERLRKRWIMQVLDLLGYSPQFLRSYPTYAEGRTIPLTHRANGIPFWLLDYNVSPDDKLAEGKRRSSPHEHFQDYLDLTDDDWGIICSGKVIRLLHDYHKTLTRNFVEADLESIFDALDVDAFRAVWRIFRADQFVTGANGVRQIEKLREQSLQEGQEIGKELRKQVKEAIRTLANGFLMADRDGKLREALAADPSAAMEFYKALLRVVYRLLFLLYIENKPGWAPVADPVWASSYSISRLRERAEEQTSTDDGGPFGFARADAEDYWEGLKVVFRIIRDGTTLFRDPIHPYGGELFDDGRLWLLGDACLHNGDLLRAIRLLTFFENRKTKQSYRVNFRSIRIDALGSVYEGLLDVAPVMAKDGTFGFAQGTERKLTGSYNTPPELAMELVKSALVPVMEDRLKDATTKAEQERALLSITVCDTACGSGAILIQALEKLAGKLCDIRLDGEEPSELHVREARRDVVTHCIHGVDQNPMAVELCKFTLWLHVAHPKLPLSYLEPRIKCGNSLVGVPLKKQVEEAKRRAEAERKRILDEYDGRLHAMPRAAMKAYKDAAYVGWPDAVPTAAFDPVTGDKKDVAKRVKATNEKEIKFAHSGQQEFDWLIIGRLADWFQRVHLMPEGTIEEVRAKADAYRSFIEGQAYEPAKAAADAWCAAFYWPLDGADEHAIVPTTGVYRKIERNPHHGDYSTMQVVRRLDQTVRFFHWDLEFPDVFQQGGFDCVLGNPPWERIKLQEQEFFATRAPEIAAAQNKAVRQRRIEGLRTANPELFRLFTEAKHTAEADSKFMRQAGRYPLTAVGDMNTYALFAEADRSLANAHGRVGVIVPTGIATDDSTKGFFADMTGHGDIASLYDFENREGLFPSVDRRFRFCVLTIGASGASAPEFAFYLTRASQVGDPTRLFTLSTDDLALLSPNTRTCPTFRTRADAEMAKATYRRVPVLSDERSGVSPWGVSFLRMFDMANDSDLFYDEPAPERLPLYESKMFHPYDHRFASVERRSSNAIRQNQAVPASVEQRKDPAWLPTPLYWVDKSDVEARLGPWEHGWMLAFKCITSATNERTCLAALLPRCGVGHVTALMMWRGACAKTACVLLANLNAVVFDYAARQKVGGLHLDFFTLKQLPVLPPQAYSEAESEYIGRRVLELVYTAWDMKPFAQDMGYDGPPFVWDEDRRAVLKAELDAYYARLYGLNRKQLRYIFDPHGLSDRELEDILDPWEEPSCAGPHLLPDNPTEDFPGETFRVLKKNDTAKYGEYRTRRLVLDAWARLEAELGPAPVRNYREEMAATLPEPAPPKAAPPRKVLAPEPAELTLVAPDVTPQGKDDSPSTIRRLDT